MASMNSNASIEGVLQAFAGANDFSIGMANFAGRDNVVTINNSYSVTNEDRDSNVSVNDILKWLRAPSFEAIHHDVFAQRAKNTCNWFIETEEFVRFVREKGIILWGTGLPAAGKTTLISVVIEHLKSSFRESQDIGVAYAYLRYGEKRKHRDILVAFIAQLVESTEIVFAHVKPKYVRAKVSGNVLTEREAIQILQDFGHMLSKLFLVVDGLDEVVDEIKEDILQSLSSLGANVIIASRPLELFKEIIPDVLHVPIQARTEDIKLLVLEKIQRSPRLQAILRGEPNLIERLSDSIKEKSQGMFLVASMQMGALRTSNTVNQLFDTLDELPSGINDMYEHTLARIDGQSPEGASIARRLFIWLLHAEEPVPLTDFPYALAVSFDRLSYNPDDLIDPSIMLSFCGGLVSVQTPQLRRVRFDKKVQVIRPGKRNEVSEASKGPGLQRDDDLQVRFIHYTTREFMEKVHFPHHRNPHTFLAVTCAIYLKASPYGRATTPRQGLESSCVPAIAVDNAALDRGHPPASPTNRFYDYALQYWHHHARESQRGGQPPHPYIISFLSSYPETLLPPCCTAHKGSALGIAVHYNLVSAIATGKLRCTHDDKGLFLWAAINDRREVIRALLKYYGSQAGDFFTIGNRGETPLHSVVETEDTGHIRFFISLAASTSFQLGDLIKAQNSFGIDPLMAVCTLEYSECPKKRTLLEILWTGSYDFHARNKEGSTAFMLAAIHCCCFDVSRRSPCPVLQYMWARDRTVVFDRDFQGRTVLMQVALTGSLTAPKSARCANDKLDYIFTLIHPALMSSLLNATDADGDKVLMYASWSVEVVEGLCHYADLSPKTIVKALSSTIYTRHDKSGRVAETFLVEVSKKGFLRHGWDDNFAVVLLAYAVKQCSRRTPFLDLLLAYVTHDCRWEHCVIEDIEDATARHHRAVGEEDSSADEGSLVDGKDSLTDEEEREEEDKDIFSHNGEVSRVEQKISIDETVRCYRSRRSAARQSQPLCPQPEVHGPTPIPYISTLAIRRLAGLPQSYEEDIRAEGETARHSSAPP